MTTQPEPLSARIRRDLIARTPPRRQPHIMGVEGMVLTLAANWGLDPEACLLAALLHDITKPIDNDRQRGLLDRVTAVEVEAEDVDFPSVWHGLTGAQEAHDTYGVTDQGILDAIAYHSTGRDHHSPVGLVLYVADFTEPSRHWDGVEKTRNRLLALDLHTAALEVAELKLERLALQGKAAHPRTGRMAAWLRTLTT